MRALSGALAGALLLCVAMDAVSMLVTQGTLGFMSLMTEFFFTTGHSLVISLSAPQPFGSTVAMVKFLSTLIGGGPIPLITGAISDAIGGPGSIRPALPYTMAILLIAVFCYVRVYRIRVGSA